MKASSRHLALLLPLLLGGCVTTVVPPEAPDDPVPVFLLDHGRHASLALPAAESGLLRYAYGDWTWYAESRPGLFAGVAALFCPTRAAFGRRHLAGDVSVAGLRRTLRVGVERIYELRVSRRAVQGLRAELEGLYAAGRAGELRNPEMDLVFVEHPEPYTGFHNSNRVVAGWLQRLGCRIEGPALFSRWRLGGG